MRDPGTSSVFGRFFSFGMVVAFCAAVLPGAGAPAHAQTIENTARAEWREGDRVSTSVSNTVSIDVDRPDLAIGTYRPGSGSGSVPLSVRPSLCGGSELIVLGLGSGQTLALPAHSSNAIRAGETLLFEIAAPLANRDRSVVDYLTATLTTRSGDREILRIFESGTDTGRFTGAIATHRTVAGVHGNCRLSVGEGDAVSLFISTEETGKTFLTASVDILVDPFGVVFDSETGIPVNGARVTLVNEVTGQDAEVFAEDGVTPWPSMLVSGTSVTDAGGNFYSLSPGEYWFPLVRPGLYSLRVEPPSPYTAPSGVSREELATLSGPGGRDFVISDASYGAPLEVAGRDPIQIDIPLDRPNVVASIIKTASRHLAQPGDPVFYTVTLRNLDPLRAKRGLTLVDLPSQWLRLRPDSIRIDGEPAGAETFVVAPDGQRLTVNVPAIEPGGVTKVTYAMAVRADAPAGFALNRAEVTDQRGGLAVSEIAVRIARDTIASRMTIMGRVTEGACTAGQDRPGIPGVRVMLEDGSFAITDRDGRYHFEGVTTGTHVVQVQGQTLPQGGSFVNCDRSTRSAESAVSRFVIGQGGSLAIADFHAVIPGWTAPINDETAPVGGFATMNDEVSDIRLRSAAQAAGGGDRDWFALGDGPAEFLFPEIEHNPRAPAVRAVIRHEADQTVELLANDKSVDALTFDGSKVAPDGSYALSIWRGIALNDENTRLIARVLDADGRLSTILTRDVAFVSGPWDAELVKERSTLIADGKNRPIIAVRFTDRRGRPVRDGVSGTMTVGAPYESAALLDRLQLNQVAAQAPVSPTWIIEGDEGIALIELAPTMISGPLHLEFNFADDRISRRRELESWIVPGDLEWTVIGLAEGSVGARTIADNMERTGSFESDLGDEARVALYAKGRVLGKFLLTLAYDSAKQEDDQRLLGTLDPNAYYSVFADGSDRRFDAASRDNLYVRVETSTFYALYGDFVTGFDQTVLARYQRTVTGAKAEGRFGDLHFQGFAAEIASRFRRDEMQGAGISGPYRFSSRALIPNSERVIIETRDRFRSEIIIDRRELTRFIDYDIDLLSGTIRFVEPVLSRDFQLNPQFIVIDYEVEEGRGDADWNAGARADYSIGNDRVRIGATAITDKGDGVRTEIGAIDLRTRIGATTEIRAELAASRDEDETATAWLVEAEHRTGSLDMLAYAREVEEAFGSVQINGAETGRRKIGFDARYAFDERASLTASAWHDESLIENASRRAVQLLAGYRTADSELRLGVSHFSDHTVIGEKLDSTVLEAAVSHRLLDNRLELGIASSIALDQAESIDLPTRHRLRARYAVTEWLRLIGNYEIADGKSIEARTFNGGVEVSPWSGGRVVTTFGQQDIAEFGKRSFAAFGLSQSLPVTAALTLDATIDGNRTIAGASPLDVINPEQPVATGGHLGQNGALFEDFTAVTLGASWRHERWAATGRGEYRDGEFADRRGLNVGLIRQLGEGVVIGSGVTWTQATGEGAAETAILDAGLSAAYRPVKSSFALLGKLEFRSDRVTAAIAGDDDPVGRTALAITGDGKSQRLVSSLSANWSPRGNDDGELVRRTEIGLFLGARYGLDRFEGFDLAGTALLGGLDARFGIGERFEIGGSATVRTSLEDNLTSFAMGPQIGFVPAANALVTVGYNIAGFRDPDFSTARETERGLYASVRLKFDADSFAFLGLGER